MAGFDLSMLIMPHEERAGFARRGLSRRRSFLRGHDTDDRGWTPLHIGARKGKVREVINLLSLFFFGYFDSCLEYESIVWKIFDLLVLD